jgi:hypothetical protein
MKTPKETYTDMERLAQLVEVVLHTPVTSAPEALADGRAGRVEVEVGHGVVGQPAGVGRRWWTADRRSA